MSCVLYKSIVNFQFDFHLLIASILAFSYLKNVDYYSGTTNIYLTITRHTTCSHSVVQFCTVNIFSGLPYSQTGEKVLIIMGQLTDPILYRIQSLFL